MSAELADINDFIRVIPPFDTLTEDKTAKLTKSIQILYSRKGETLPPDGIKEAKLFMIRKGALAYYDQDNQLLSKYSEGDLCSVFLLPDKKVQISVLTEEDTLLYAIDKSSLDEIIEDCPEARSHFGQTEIGRAHV